MTQLTLNLQGDLEPAGEMRTLSSLAGSRDHANHTQWRENEKAKKMNAIYGQRCLEQYERLNQSTSWGKMFLASLIGMGDWYSMRCILTWSLRGTKSRPWLYLRRRSMPHMEEIECGLLLPTPAVMQMDYEPKEGWKWMGNYWKDQNGRKRQTDLTTSVKMTMLPTPQAQEGDKITAKENQDSITKIVRQATGTTSQLNARFVAEMMGFPPNWTELPFQSGETNQ